MATMTTEVLPEPRLEDERNGLAAREELALAPLVEKIAHSLARGLAVAMKELENHIASETRKVSESVGRRLETLQASVHDLAQAVSDQRSAGQALQDRCRQLESATSSLQDAGARQAEELAALRHQATEFSKSVTEQVEQLCKEFGVQQDDITAIKSTLCGFSTRVDAIAERLDRQAEALRSMYATYAQRESELEQLVDGLARLRTYPAPKPTNGL